MSDVDPKTAIRLCGMNLLVAIADVLRKGGLSKDDFMWWCNNAWHADEVLADQGSKEWRHECGRYLLRLESGEVVCAHCKKPKELMP